MYNPPNSTQPTLPIPSSQTHQLSLDVMQGTRARLGATHTHTSEPPRAKASMSTATFNRGARGEGDSKKRERQIGTEAVEDNSRLQ